MNTNSREISSWQGSSLVNLLQEIANNWSGACPRTYAVMLTDLLDSNGLPPVRFSEAFFTIASRPQAPTSTGTSLSSTTAARVLETSAATGAKILENTAASATRLLENTSTAVSWMVEDATAAATRYLETSVATIVESLGGTIRTAVVALENATSSINRKVPVTVSPHQIAEEYDDADIVETSCIPSIYGKQLKDHKLGKLFPNLGAKPFSKPASKKVINQGKDLLASKSCGNRIRKNSKSSDFLSQSIFLGTKSEKPTTSGIKAASPTTISTSKATTPSNTGRLKLAGTPKHSSIKDKLKGVGLLAGAKGTPLTTNTVTRANARHNPRLKRLQKSKKPMLFLESPGMFTPNKK